MDTGSLTDWLSFAATVGGIGVSVWLHWLTVANRKAEDASRARAAALALYPAYRSITTDLEWAVAQLNEGRIPDDLGTDENQQDIDAGFLIARRPLLEANQSQLPLLGENADPVFRAHYAVEDVLSELGNYTAEAEGWPRFTGEGWNSTEAKLRYASAQARIATDVLHRVVAG
jgi:hypothetical protein